MRNRKSDQHPIVADLMFVDAEHHNYHPKPKSPALRLGFQDIDTSQIRLNEDVPARSEESGSRFVVCWSTGLFVKRWRGILDRRAKDL